MSWHWIYCEFFAGGADEGGHGQVVVCRRQRGGGRSSEVGSRRFWVRWLSLACGVEDWLFAELWYGYDVSASWKFYIYRYKPMQGLSNAGVFGLTFQSPPECSLVNQVLGLTQASGKMMFSHPTATSPSADAAQELQEACFRRLKRMVFLDSIPSSMNLRKNNVNKVTNVTSPFSLKRWWATNLT